MLAPLLLAGAGAAHAQTPEPAPRTHVAVLAGVFEVGDRVDQSAELGAQYRFGTRWWRLQPVAGGMAGADGAYTLYGGVALDLPLGRHAYVRGTFAPGLYGPGSQGKDLGHTLQFRSGIETGWRSPTGWGLGLELYHLSNGRLGETNPGSNSLVVTLSIPVGGAGRNPEFSQYPDPRGGSRVASTVASR